MAERQPVDEQVDGQPTGRMDELVPAALHGHGHVPVFHVAQVREGLTDRLPLLARRGEVEVRRVLPAQPIERLFVAPTMQPNAHGAEQAEGQSGAVRPSEHLLGRRDMLVPRPARGADLGPVGHSIGICLNASSKRTFWDRRIARITP